MDETMVSIVVGVIVSVITGAIAGNMSSQKTISALIVHIDYLRADLKRHDDQFDRQSQAITRAHERIDRLEHSGT